MLPRDDTWPASIQALYEQVAGSTPEAVLASRPQWTEQLAEWVRGATLDEREMAQVATWSRLDAGDRSPGELLFLLAHCGELLWPYSEPPKALLQRLLSRQEQLVQAMKAEGQGEAVEPLVPQVEAELSKVLARYLKRHPEELVTLVSGVRCTFDGKVLRFNETLEVDLKLLLGSERRVIGRLDQLRALLPYLREGRDRLVGFIRERAARIPWRECRDILEEKLFQLVATPGARSELRGFLGSYAQGKGEARWCTRASLLLARNLEEGGALEVIENLSELLAYFEAPVEGLRGALQALVASIHEDRALERHRLVADKCWEHLKPEKEPSLALDFQLVAPCLTNRQQLLALCDTPVHIRQLLFHFLQANARVGTLAPKVGGVGAVLHGSFSDIGDFQFQALRLLLHMASQLAVLFHCRFQ